MADAHPGQVLREALGLTHPEFAEKIGRSRTFVMQVEGGRDSYGSASALAIADLYRREMIQLGITVEDLLRGCPDSPSGDDQTEAAS